MKSSLQFINRNNINMSIIHLFMTCSTGGLIWISEWNALLHPVASAFLALVYSDYMLTSQTPEVSCSGQSLTPADIRKFVISQVHSQYICQHTRHFVVA